MQELNRHKSLIISRKVPALFQDPSKYVPLPKIESDPTLNSALCLRRKDLVTEDKRKKLIFLKSFKTTRDISHILDIPAKTQKTPFLPNTLIDIKKSIVESDKKNLILDSDKKNSILETKPRHPTSIKETENIERWITEMNKSYLPELEKVLKTNAIPDSSVVSKVESVYFQAMNEILHQISVHCKSRAELLRQIIQTLSTVWKKQPEHLSQLLKKQAEIKETEFEALNSSHKAQISTLQEKIKNLQAKNDSHQQELVTHKSEIAQLKEHISNINWDYEEFIFFKSRKLKTDSVACQTDSPEDQNDSLETSSSDSSFSESSLLSLESPKIKFNRAPSLHSDNVETAQAQFREQLQILLNTIDPPLIVDFSLLAENALIQSKDSESWLIGFRTALSISPKYNQSGVLHLEHNHLDHNHLEVSGIHNSKKELSVSTRYRVPALSQKTHSSRNLNESCALTPRDTSTVVGVLASLANQPFSKIARLAKSSQKKISDHVNHYIQSAIVKKYTKSVKFSEFIFLKFIEKYSIKSLADRKFQELVSGCIVYSNESPKFLWFLRALNAGKPLDLPDLSPESCEMFIKLFEFMLQNRIGVIPDLPNSFSTKLFPYLRALECLKTKFEQILSKPDFSNLLDQTTKLVIPDPASINKSGMVELDKFIDICMDAYEKFVQDIKSGASLCARIITEYHYLTKGEICVILKHFCPQKFAQILKSLPLDEQGLIDKEEFVDACVAFGILTSQSVEMFFFGCEKNVKGILKRVEENEGRILELAKKDEDGLSAEEWENKLFELKIKLKCQEVSKYLQLWHLLKKEIEYLEGIKDN